jgi:hypothetical protein
MQIVAILMSCKDLAIDDDAATRALASHISLGVST